MGGKIVELTFAEKNNAQNVFRDIRDMATSPYMIVCPCEEYAARSYGMWS